MHSDSDPSCSQQPCPPDFPPKAAASTAPTTTTTTTTTPTTAPTTTVSTALTHESAGIPSSASPPYLTTNTAALTEATTNTATTSVPLPALAPFPTRTSLSTIVSSHKRSREPSAMTDPSEAARYTPPRDMFKHPSSTADSDDIISLPSEGSLQDSEHEIQIDHAPLSTLRPGSDRFHGDSELDNLGQQLSIHSPEKTITAAADHEQELSDSDSDSDTPEPDSGTWRQRANAAEPLTFEEAVRQEEDEQDQLQGIEEDQEQKLQTVPPAGQQLDTIRNKRYQRLEVGDPWYLINQAWFASFRKYCSKMDRGEDAEHPGEIDNTVLFSGNSLRQDIQNSVVVLPQEAWDNLVAWYGTSTAPIMRRVVNTGSDIAPNNIIDYYPPVFTIYKVVEASQADSPLFAMNEPETLEVSRTTKYGDLKSALLARLGESGPGPARLWAFSADPGLVEGNVIGSDAIIQVGATCLEGTDDETPLAEITGLVDSRDLALEVAVNGAYLVPYKAPTPVQTYDANMSSTFPRSIFNPRANMVASQEHAVNGICGLSNLGNTCFMNSALQCLSNAPDLTRYILSGAWRDELNVDNPLGMGGEVARAYANLIDKLWNGSSKVFSPREFKLTIGRFAPSFTGYHQHDCQELLAFLLDGLHEDLNRIVKKPYTEVPDSDGRPDEEVANDCWQIHKARNDSIIVDLFQGQYKSTLVCPECQKVSVTFDPFMYLSLPLPIDKKWVGTVTYVPYNPEQPVVDIRVQLPKGSTQKQLKERIAELMGTQASHLYSAEIFTHRIYKTHDNADAVDELSETDKNFIYELPVPDFTNAPDHVVFPVHNILEPVMTYSRISTFGHPMMVCVTKEEAKDPDAVYKAIVQQASRYTTMDLYATDSTLLENEKRSDEEISDVSMSPPEEPSTEKEPKSGLFRMMVYSPPTLPTPRYQYRSVTRSTLYAPHTTPAMSDMVDMYQRVALREPETVHEMKSLSSHSRIRSTFDDDRDDDLGTYPRPGSPSTLSDSSRSSNQPLILRPDDDELSEEDDPVTLTTVTGRDTILPNGIEECPSKPFYEAEPAVRPGEMVYCVWDRSLESSISAPERRYRAMSSYRNIYEDEDHTSSVRALWDERGPLVTDPVLEEELSTSKKGKKTITLEDCLNEYTREEQLGEEDLWYCPSCKKHQQATKKLDIWRLPDILVVHLKRFSHTRAWRDKIDALVDFPIYGLDLSGKALKEEDREENVYDLFGVSNHMGGLGGGHYTAYAKNEKLDQWFNFDDSHVSPVTNVESIKSSSAYLLFYRRRNAVVREYEQRPAEMEPTVNPARQIRGGYLEPTRTRSLLLQEKDGEDEEYGPWGKPGSEPFQDIGPIHHLGVSDPEDEDIVLPPYSPMMGATGMVSPPSSFSGGLTFMSDKRHGKGRLLDADEEIDEPGSTGMSDYMDSRADGAGHSPGLSTCASDGSNPGTANVSPGFTSPTLASPMTQFPPAIDLDSIGTSLLSSISRQGGRIDDSDDMNDGAERSTGMSYPCETVGVGAGISNSTSTMSGLEPSMPEVRNESDNDHGEQDDVNMIQWQKNLPGSRGDQDGPVKYKGI